MFKHGDTLINSKDGTTDRIVSVTARMKGLAKIDEVYTLENNGGPYTKSALRRHWSVSEV